MATEWHYSRDGRELGPVDFDELKRSVSAGLLRAGDLVWCEGMSDWEEASRIDSLFPQTSIEWFYAQGGDRFGPVSGDYLKQLAVAGRLQPSDLVWCEGEPDWEASRSDCRPFSRLVVSRE